jgi:L-asparagine transporter-like permease
MKEPQHIVTESYEGYTKRTKKQHNKETKTMLFIIAFIFIFIGIYIKDISLILMWCGIIILFIMSRHFMSKNKRKKKRRGRR